jgi:hypothetical protein
MYERVYIKIIKLSSFWNGMLRFGVTNINPISFEETSTRLPKYVYPDLTNKVGYWAGSMKESVSEKDIICFYFNSNGELHYSVNDKNKGIFISGIEIYKEKGSKPQPLWGIFDIYGNTLAIELIEAPTQLLQPTQPPLPPQPSNTNERKVKLNSLGSSNFSSISSLTTPSQSLSFNNYNTTSNSNSINSNSSDQDDDYQQQQIDHLMLAYRRLCVDNHLNETLQTSIINYNQSDKNSQQSSLENDKRISNCNFEISQLNISTF